MIEQEIGGQILNIVATYAWTGMPGVVHSACAKSGVSSTMTKHSGLRMGVATAFASTPSHPGPFESEGASGKPLAQRGR